MIFLRFRKLAKNSNTFATRHIFTSTLLVCSMQKQCGVRQVFLEKNFRRLSMQRGTYLQTCNSH